MKEIINAMHILELPDKASLINVKKNFRSLILKWHPDKCQKNKTKCHEITKKLVNSYTVLLNYCKNNNLKIVDVASILEKKNAQNEATEFWYKHFGKDHFWSNTI